MKILKHIIEFVLGTSIMWLPILGLIIAEKLSKIITMNQIMILVYILIPSLIIVIKKMNIEERKRKYGRKVR